MVKTSSSTAKLKQLAKLQKQREAKEKELQELEKTKAKELKDVEKQLEDAVADLMTSEAEEIQTEEQVSEEKEQVSLEEAVSEGPQREIEESAGGMEYQILEESIRNLQGIYNEVKEELAAGRTDSPVVQEARELIYHMQKKDVYVTNEAQEIVQSDQSGPHYMNRLDSLLDMFEQKAGQGVYKQ